MSSNPTTIAYIADQLASLSPHIRSRKMFGEYALYYHDRVIALVCDDTLFVKMTSQGKSLLGSDYQEGVPYPGAKPHIKVEEEVINDRELLCRLITTTYQNLPIKKWNISRAK